MRLPILLSLLLWSPLAWAGTACFEKASGKWLGDYCSSCDPGSCVKNWVTNNPQLGYTADQIDERQASEAEGKTLVEAVNKPIREAREAKRQQRVEKVKQKLSLTDKEFEDLQEALR